MRLLWLRRRFGGDVLRIDAVAFSEVAAKDAAGEGEADAGDEEEDGVGEVAGQVREQEDTYSRVEKDGEDVAERASRHEVPPCQEDSGACASLRATVYFIDAGFGDKDSSGLARFWSGLIRIGWVRDWLGLGLGSGIGRFTDWR